MLRGLLAVIHKKRNPGHRIWFEEMIWSGGRGVAWFCTCRKAWWPAGAFAPGERDTIDREPPWERKW
jgi:hypothetical protein